MRWRKKNRISFLKDLLREGMVRKVFVIILLLFIGLTWSNSLPEVENFYFQQRNDGSKIVDVYYDVTDADGDTLSVSMQVSDDGGETWEISCDLLSGDVGDGILSGTGKHIIWNFGAENPVTFGINCQVRLQIDDHFINFDVDWCYVAAGEYTWGEFDEIQTIDYDFEIMKYEVTNVQYLAYLEEAFTAGDIWIEDGDIYGFYEGDEYNANGEYIFYDLGTPVDFNYAQISYESGSFVINVPPGYNPGDFDDHPVVEVSWFGANAYSEYYNFRLPTEYEWEKAARGMTGYDYSWGNEINGERANYWGSNDPWENGTTPVGFYNGQNYNGFQTIDSPSPYNCYDICGNVYDWTDSWRSETSSARILRGECWNNFGDENDLRTWYRHWGPTDSSYDGIGFRCARTVENNNTAPNQPENPYPENGALAVPVNITLTWEGTDPDGDDLTYDVYFGEIPELDESHLLAEGIGAESWQLAVLEYNTEYYWQIVASDGELQTAGYVWSFTTIEETNLEL